MNALEFDQYLRKIKKLVTVKLMNHTYDKDLSYSEIKIMMQIYMEKDLRTSNLAKLNSVSLAAIMHKTEDLIKKGYLEKKLDDNDNRNKFFKLTAKGNEICAELVNSVETKMQEFLNFLGDDAANLERIIGKIIDYLED